MIESGFKVSKLQTAISYKTEKALSFMHQAIRVEIQDAVMPMLKFAIP
jgi:hypothetical protein